MLSFSFAVDEEVWKNKVLELLDWDWTKRGSSKKVGTCCSKNTKWK